MGMKNIYAYLAVATAILTVVSIIDEVQLLVGPDSENRILWNLINIVTWAGLSLLFFTLHKRRKAKVLS